MKVIQLEQNDPIPPGYELITVSNFGRLIQDVLDATNSPGDIDDWSPVEYVVKYVMDANKKYWRLYLNPKKNTIIEVEI